MNTFNHSKNAALLAVVLGAAAFGGVAQADQAPLGAESRVVHYADLNLDTTAGAKVLYQRIRSAAQQVCGDVDDRRLEVAAAARACVAKAIVSSVRAVNRAQLTELANAHGYEVKTSMNVASAR